MKDVSLSVSRRLTIFEPAGIWWNSSVSEVLTLSERLQTIHCPKPPNPMSWVLRVRRSFQDGKSWPFLFAVILDFYPKNRTTGCGPKVWKVTSVTLKRKNPSNIWCKTPMDYQTIYQTSPVISSHLIHIWGTPHSVLPNTKRPRMKGAFRDVVRHGDHRPLRQIRCSKLDKIFMDCDLSHWRTRSAKHLEV